jgi:hypothetical protein
LTIPNTNLDASEDDTHTNRTGEVRTLSLEDFSSLEIKIIDENHLVNFNPPLRNINDPLLVKLGEPPLSDHFALSCILSMLSSFSGSSLSAGGATPMVPNMLRGSTGSLFMSPVSGKSPSI